MAEKYFINGDCGKATQRFSFTGNCDVAEGLTDYLIVMRPNGVLTVPADGDVSAAVAAAIQLPYSNPNKAWLFPKTVSEPTVEGGDVQTNAIGTRGGTKTVGQNPPSITYVVEGRVCLYNQLAAFKGASVRVLRVDSAKNIFGVGNIAVNAGVEEVTLRGFDASLWITSTANDGSNAELTNIVVAYGVDYWKQFEQRSNAVMNTIPAPLTGVRAVLKPGGVDLVTLCDRISILPEIGSLVGVAMFVDGDGGNPTAVTYSDVTGLLTIAPAGTYTLAAPTALAALGIVNYEGTIDPIVIA